MITFTIDSENSITAFDTTSVGELPSDTQRFASEAELAALAGDWPGARLVEIWNSLPGVQPVNKFTNRTTAVRRIWKTIQSLDPGMAQPAPKRRSQAKRAASNAKAANKRGTAPGTKTEQVLTLLRQPGGASLGAIMRLTQWQSHSVRGFISGHLGKKLGLKVKSFRRDGERRYAIRH